ncbi:MAG: hypothetical protein ACM3PC_10235 [Deltaproteobacteria bacterium]
MQQAAAGASCGKSVHAIATAVHAACNEYGRILTPSGTGGERNAVQHQDHRL